MASSSRTSGPAVLPGAPAVDDYGMVVRVVSEPALVTWATSQIVVDLVAVQVTPTPLVNRRAVSLRAKTTAPGEEIFVGPSNAVLTTTGAGLKDRESLSLDLEAGAQIWAIATAPGQTLMIVELAT